jgi:SAM-dependent methyltransferase
LKRSASRDGTRYDLFGWDYAALNPLSDAEVEWHLGWAERTGGPILGLACGTARLLCRLAEAGHAVTGLDLSEAMLGLARANARALPPAARSRIDLVQGDMARFDLGRQFGLAIIADNSFRELSTRRELGRCLRAIRRHLRPGGKLLITERRFRASLFPGGVRELGWSEPTMDPGTGGRVRRRGRIGLHKGGRRVSGVFEYEAARPDGATERVACPWSAPILGREEYVALFRRAGFDAEVYTDYRMRPCPEDGGYWCFACTPSNG